VPLSVEMLPAISLIIIMTARIDIQKGERPAASSPISEKSEKILLTLSSAG
jgi:hypothetical protein